MTASKAWRSSLQIGGRKQAQKSLGRTWQQTNPDHERRDGEGEQERSLTKRGSPPPPP